MPYAQNAIPHDEYHSEPALTNGRILFVAPECAPYAKEGGLADVVAALPLTLQRLGAEVRILIPLYGSIDREAHGLRPDGAACVHLGGGVEHWIGVYSAQLHGQVPVWFVDFGAYFDRPGIYGDHSGEYGDNAYRFALLSKAALQLCKDRGFIPDVMHLHDWPAALAAVFLKTWDRVGSPLSGCATVLTIHNIGHQGKYPADAFGYLGLGAEHFNGDTFEDYGRISLLKAGVRFADGITTVSPTHLDEILSPDGGHGLAPYLNRRREDLAGILNGVDYQIWNPATDPLIPARYSPEDLTGKGVCRQTLQRFFGLEEREDLPLFGLISRLVLQKGIDLLREALPQALETLPLQFVMLGSGERDYEAFFRWLAGRYPGRVGCHLGYSEELSHLIEAGADLFLMPSLYEPCGLNQIYSMKYGTLPVVRATGGLIDTVTNYQAATTDGTGFTFDHPSGAALLDTLRWVVATWFDRSEDIVTLRRRAMAQDFSWTAAAHGYLGVYQRAVARRQAWG